MTYQVQGIPVIQRPGIPPDANNYPYSPFAPQRKVLPKGYQKHPENESLPLPKPLVIDQDVAIPLRDGTILYADIIRPYEDNEGGEAARYPVLIPWSPYGKTGDGFFNLDRFPYRVGVPHSKLSGFEKFEGVDPATWCAQGYAIVNVNSRGAYDSQGDLIWWGTQEGRDGYDVVEWSAEQPWSNGKVGLVGNSWLAIAQWFIAAENPPHLCAIAPWEGAADMYRDIILWGGVPNTPFWSALLDVLRGRQQVEDVPAMAEKYPLWNEYWQDKRAKLENIDIPTYILASYGSNLHTSGSFRGFRKIKTDKKWLRVHPHFEWYDLYSEESNSDLQRFFDRYLKGEDNGWETTPPVRLTLLGFNQPNVVNRAEADYPIPRTKYTTFYLDASSSAQSGHDKLSPSPVAAYGERSYNSEDLHATVGFTATFDQYTEIAGYPRMTLWVSCPDNDDLDLFAKLRKLDRQGQLLEQINIPLHALQGATSEDDIPSFNVYRHLGPTARLRVSHRGLNAPVQDGDEVDTLLHHQHEEKVTPAGRIVEATMGFWPCGMLFQPGESLQLVFSGHDMTLPEFEVLRDKHITINKGTHIIHTGDKYPSRLVLPFI